MPLAGRTIVLGVTGSIAAYKAAELASTLTQRGAQVTAVLTAAARQFITPVTFEHLTHRRCVTDLFDRENPEAIEHVALADRADAVLIAPASANCLGKLAHGIADDALTTLMLVVRCPVVVAPAMNTRMMEHPAVRDNAATLKKRGLIFVEPESGTLACGHFGAGRLAAPEKILAALERALEPAAKARPSGAKGPARSKPPRS